MRAFISFSFLVVLKVCYFTTPIEGTNSGEASIFDTLEADIGLK